jgi:hypothetical protein
MMASSRLGGTPLITFWGSIMRLGMTEKRRMIELPVGTKWAEFRAICKGSYGIEKGLNECTYVECWAHPSWLMHRGDLPSRLVAVFYE